MWNNLFSGQKEFWSKDLYSIGRNLLFKGYPIIIAIISFAHFSPIYNYGIGSDQAITILQAYDFRLPEDLYYWGQKRLGSVVPMISNVIYRLTGFNHMWIVAVVNHLILLLGCFTFLSFFKTNFAKIVFPLFWFIPIPFFVGFVELGLPQGISLSFLSFFFYFRLNKQETIFNRFISWVFLFVACWASDVIFIAAAIFVFVYHAIHTKALLRNFKLMFRSLSLSLLELVAIVSVVLVFKKITGGAPTSYASFLFSSWEQTKAVFHHLKLNFLEIFNQPMNFYDILLLVYLVSSVLIVVISLYQFVFRTNPRYKTLHWFFLFYGVAILIVFFTSRWVYINGFRARYLLDMYVALVVFSLLVLEKRRIGKLILIPCLAGVLLSLIPRYYPHKVVSRLDQLKGLEDLGNCGIISIYWVAYEFACIHPEKIMGMPHDEATNRKPEQIHEVFAQPTIYICNVNWFNDFPDTMSQYGYLLKRTENEKFIYKYRFVEYEILEKPTLIND